MNTLKRHSFVSLLFAASVAISPAMPTYASAPRCENAFRDISGSARVRYFKDIAWLFKSIEPEVRQELSKVNNALGTDIEVTQTKSFLNRVAHLEMAYLDSINPVENTVIYGSTNVPLYTLVTQVFLSASFSKNVWFRTPAATRDIYVKIFNLFEQYLPREYTKHIHLITDPADLAYDQFNRVYVMGQNKSGTKSLRPPANLVILTGNPDTARTMIERNTRNLQKLATQYPLHKQLFLGFLAGVNPAIVVPSAKENMKMVVEKVTFPYLVNGGQDCMNSDIVFVQSSVVKEFTSEILAKMSTLKVTSNEDREGGLTPLTMTKSFDKLLAYKEKYKKYLINPTATINADTKQVSPHIFLIPFEKFKDLDIQEHFAPFITIVKYEDFDQLQNASMDSRLQKKAMSALIYGADRMAPDVERARNIFRNAQHSVYLNTHLYEEFEMNMPFGGIGSDTSISSLVQMTENGQLKVENRNRPLLISKEASSAFAKQGSYETPPAANDSTREKYKYPDSVRNESSSFQSLLEAGQAGGITILRDHRLDNQMLKEASELYGVKVVNKPSMPQKIKGIVLHVVPVTKQPSNDSSLVGDRNPLLNEEKVLKILQQNKMAELKLAQRVDPSVMPGVHTYNDFFNSSELNQLNQGREKLISLINNLPSSATDLQKQHFESALYVYTREFLDMVHSKTHRGAYIKNYGEYASGDLGSTVTSFSASSRQITKEFAMWLYQLRALSPQVPFENQKAQKFLSDALYSNFTRFVNTLLLKPSELLIQHKLELAQTQQGATMEFRVDFMNGTAVSSRMRFGLEHYPQEMAKAKQVLNDFFKKAPPEIQRLSGGADVALTADGKWILFEFNFGGASGTLYAEYYPFEANRIFSTLQGQETPLLKKLTQLHKMPVRDQNAFLKRLKNEKPLWWKPNVQAISQVEWAKELRDAFLNEWSQAPNKIETATALRENLRMLFADLGSHGNMDFQRLYETAEDYIRRELGKSLR